MKKPVICCSRLVRPGETENVPLEESAGRVLAQKLYAAENGSGV